jgi:two-component system nitrogen regulation response regulator NtrX
LRERRDDIPSLVRHFADLFARDNNFQRKTFTRAAMERLRQMHWRGNIRELRNFVERLMIMSPTKRSTPRTFRRRRRPAGAWREQRRVRPSADALDARCDTAGVQVRVRARVSWWRDLRENGWNISKTAEVIDTPRSNLYKKLEQYQIAQEKDGSHAAKNEESRSKKEARVANAVRAVSR